MRRKTPDFLCNLDCCTNCIKFRELNGIKPPRKMQRHRLIKKETLQDITKKK